MVDRYDLRGMLGRGGMAEVHDGWDTRLDRPVAVKLLHPGLDAQPDNRDRFLAEALAAASLNHPNIVAVHDSGEDDGTPFIVMERLPGATLADEIAHGPLPPARVRLMLDNILGAMAAAHAQQILHRDIKPGNILRAADGDGYKLADFGIAKTGGAAYTMTGQIIGTMAYLSPERLSGAPASVADDLYAVGVVGYEALTGRHPFGRDENVGALAKAILYDTPPPLRAARPDVDPQLAALIERSMSREPGLRFATADDMRAALHGRVPVPPAGSGGAPRPATKVLEPSSTATAFAVPMHPGQPLPGDVHRNRKTKRVLAATGVVAALAVTALAVALDSPTTVPAQPVSESTTSEPAPAPPSTPPPPQPTANTLAPPPAPTPVVQPSDAGVQPPGLGNRDKRGNGNKGNNGKGDKKN